MKWILKSKTVWVAISIAALSTFEGDAKIWIAEHPGQSGRIAAFLMLTLRLLTTGAIALKKSDAEPCPKADCPRKS